MQSIFFEYLLVPDIVLDAQNTAVHETDTVPALLELMSYHGKTYSTCVMNGENNIKEQYVP